MTDSSRQPTSGSLSAKVIRACRVHKTCSLECPERRVLDMGVIASFDNGSARLPRPSEGLKTGETEPIPSLAERVKHLFGR